MFRNYLTAALRNLARNKLYASINIAGLSVGFSAAILIALFVRHEFSYETFLPEHERTFLVPEIVGIGGANPIANLSSPAELAAWLKADFASIEAIARLYPESGSLRRGEIDASEDIYWSDANVFDVLRLPVIAGDLKTALEQPDSIVITRKIARKYFGRDNPVGETIEINRQHSMRVTAILADLPTNTDLTAQIFAAGHAAFSPLAVSDSLPAPLASGSNFSPVLTYMRLTSATQLAALQNALPAAIARHTRLPPGFNVSFPVLPITDVHLHLINSSTSLTTIYAILAVGLLIILLASINFVNLMTARAARRATEVGVRKAAGATRSDLIKQFIGESLLYVVLSMVLATAWVELLLPSFNAFLDRSLDFNYWRDLKMVGGMFGLALLVGTLAGAYPAFILSAFRPATVLKNGVVKAGNTGTVRQVLVVSQFAILIGLILATGIIYRQTRYALNEGLRLDQDRVLVITSSCRDAFKEAIESLPDVRAAACSMSVPSLPTIFNSSQSSTTLPNGTEVLLWYSSVDFGFFEFYGLRPLAGRFFARDYGTDMLQVGKAITRESIVINETAVRKLGFVSPEKAIGSSITCNHVLSLEQRRFVPPHPCEIIGVVPDYPADSVRKLIEPWVYYVLPSQFTFLSVKLSGKKIPETLNAIDQLWKTTGDPQPINRTFLNQRVQQLYLDITRQTQVFATFAVVALFVACLGLFGLSAFTAERRTQEIGVRKALGATTFDVMRLLVWQFTKPVLWANLIAWPVAAYVMNRWLQGFAYHIDLSPWLFVSATAVALAIALLTVSAHCYLVARAKPVTALRYE